MEELSDDASEMPFAIPPQLSGLQGLLKEIHDMDAKVGSEEESSILDQDISEDEDGCPKNPTKVKQQISACKKELNQTKQDMLQIKKALSMLMEIRNSFLTELAEKAKAEPTNAGYENKLADLLQSTAESMPLYIGEDEEEDIPPLCGAIQVNSDYVSQVGDDVAAFVKVRGKDEEEWILSKVNSFSEDKNEYKVSDIDKESSIYTVARSHVIPLPTHRAHPVYHPEAIFDKGCLVLALYPKTTCFYKAVVHQIPRRPEEPYLVSFADSSYPSGFSQPDPVHQRYVLIYKNATGEVEEGLQLDDGWATAESANDSDSADETRGACAAKSAARKSRGSKRPKTMGKKNLAKLHRTIKVEQNEMEVEIE